MEILLQRIAKKATYTIGHVYVDGKYQCDSIEDTDRGLMQGMSVEAIMKKKVHGQTAIPMGRYQVTWTYSNHFKKNMPLVNNVPGFEGIRIHSGNTAADTEGCLIMGQNKVVGKVINSRVETEKVYDLIQRAIFKGDKVWITIK